MIFMRIMILLSSHSLSGKTVARNEGSRGRSPRERNTRLMDPVSGRTSDEFLKPGVRDKQA